MVKIILAALFILMPVGAGAQSPWPLPVVAAWDGHKAAASLTFDDSDPSHLDLAIPELNRRGLHGTFFLIANKTTREGEWRQALKSGQELGNHSLDHLHPASLTPGQLQSQVSGAQEVLQDTFGVPFLTFAYPYTEITPDLLKWVKKTSFLARGGYGNYYMKPESNPDWFDIPSQMTMTATPFSTYQQWIDQDFKDGAWMVFMIHGLEGTPWGYQPIKKVVFEKILDALQAKDIWVETFSKIGAYWQAQKIFEKTQPVQKDGQMEWTWEVPNIFPTQTVLRMKLSSTGQQPALGLYQDGTRLLPDAQGLYSIAFDDKELMEKPLAKN